MEITYYMNVGHQTSRVKNTPTTASNWTRLQSFPGAYCVEYRYNQENSFEKDERDDDTGRDDVIDYDRRIYKT